MSHAPTTTAVPAPRHDVDTRAARTVRTVRTADWLADELVALGLRRVYQVPGGGAMHLNDAVGAHPLLEVVHTHHEQTAAIAAETDARVTSGLGVCLVTTGPGGTNAITGLAGSWLDGIPVLFVSGQVKRADLAVGTGVRQRGVQELDTTAIVAPLTKYAVRVDDPRRIRYHLQKAVHLATTGRTGPVWLDIPLDVQGARIDPDDLPAFDPAELGAPGTVDAPTLAALAARITAMIADAERPVLLLGAGVRRAGAEHAARRLVEQLGIPVLTTWPAHGVLPDDHELYAGRPGPLAPRGANFTVQNADLLLAIGARLDLVVTGYAPADFAPAARRIVVDVDPAELAKLDGVAELPVCADAGAMIDALLATATAVPTDLAARDAWLRRCRDWKYRYPVVTDEHRANTDRVSTYAFAQALSRALDPHDMLVTGCSGSAIEIFLLATELREGQELFYNTALGAMGTGVPVALGACLARDRRRTVCVDGDGGFQLNVQDLETIRRLNLPVTFFLLSNDGYASIRASQQRHFGRVSGADEPSGLTLPPVAGIAAAYGFRYAAIETQKDLDIQIRDVLDTCGPVLVEVLVPLDEIRAPALASAALPDGRMVSRPLEDLWPFLDRDELAANMIVSRPESRG